MRSEREIRADLRSWVLDKAKNLDGRVLTDRDAAVRAAVSAVGAPARTAAVHRTAAR